MSKSNPYDPNYIMKRDQCSFEEAVSTIEKLKSKNAWAKGKKITNKKNPYNVAYVMERDNCSHEEAVKIISNFKRNKATSLINFIKKYGEVIGTEKYNDWKSKSLEIGHKVAKVNGKSQSKFSPEYYIRHGHSLEEAHSLALSFQYENSPLHIEYYLKRGFDIDYAKSKIRKLHDKKIGRDCYREYLQNCGFSDLEIAQKIAKSRGHFSIDNLGTEEFNKRLEKMRQTFESKGMWVPLKDLSDYKIYHKKVWKFTNLNNLSSLENYNKRGLAGQDGVYHLDHKFSISRGYIEGVSPEIIGSIKNLHFIPWQENVSKQGKCSIMLKEINNEN